MTLELRGQGDIGDGFASIDADALLKFLRRRGAVAGDPGPLPEPLCEATGLAAAGLLIAPRGGAVNYKVAPGEHVSRGTVIAEIVDPGADDPLGSAVAIRTRTDGIVASRTLIRFVPRGEIVARIVGTVPPRSGALLQPWSRLRLAGYAAGPLEQPLWSESTGRLGSSAPDRSRTVTGPGLGTGTH